MRPVHLIIDGLACFKDRQEIDFRALELFAISGPTGAGKSTLLDAIIFALYGEVPRVDNRSRTEMISAGRERVSVTLSFDVGPARYRIGRTLRRSGGHQVVLERHGDDGDGGGGGGGVKAVASGVRDVTEQVTRILGLGVSAFTQAVVLPQGEFARFLKAQPGDRRKMLSTLLKLEVYEQMRQEAQRRTTDRKGKVDSARKLLDGEYKGIDDGAVAALEAAHAAGAAALAGARAERGAAESELARLRGLHDRTRELAQAEARGRALEAQAAEIALEEARLEAAARAAALIPLLDEAARAAADAGAAEAAEATARAGHGAARRAYEERAAALPAARAAAGEIDAIRGRIARLHQVSGQLPERDGLRAAVERQQGALAALDKEASELEAALEAARAEQLRHQTAAGAAHREVEAAGYDAALEVALEGVRDRAAALGAARMHAAAAEAELAGHRAAADARAGALLPVQQAAETARRVAEEAMRDLRAAEAELRRAERLDHASHLRASLEPGLPCPVCEQVVAVPPVAGERPELARAASALDAARDRQQAAEARDRQSEGRLASARIELEAARRGLAEAEARLARQQRDVREADTVLHRELGAHAPGTGAAQAPPEIMIDRWIEARARELKLARRAFEAASARAAGAARGLDQARLEESSARDRLEDRRRSRARLDEELAASRARLAAIEEAIAAVAGAADPSAEIAAADARIRRLEDDVRIADRAADTARAELASAAAALQLKAELAGAARAEAAARAARRDAELAPAGFPDERAARAALLDAAARSRLSARVHGFAQDRRAAAEQIAALEGELGGARVSGEQLAAVTRRAAELTADVEARLGAVTRLEEQRIAARRRLARATALRAELATDERALGVYGRLAGDLRSDKLQEHVLAEVFTELVRGAATRLLALTRERYSLQFTEGDIVVVDNDNAGETRISDTLSGGETFLASLALALELSEQVQRAAGALRLDSLFIDEGFGTLDPETLAMVSETIQNLRVGGRMVGIITHIPELREEFAQQVIVTKHPGFSTVKVQESSAAAPAGP